MVLDIARYTPIAPIHSQTGYIKKLDIKKFFGMININCTGNEWLRKIVVNTWRFIECGYIALSVKKNSL